MGASAERIPDWQKIDFVGKRRIWFSIATGLLVVSIALIVFKGLNLGIDFEGGSQVSFETPQPTTVDACARRRRPSAWPTPSSRAAGTRPTVATPSSRSRQRR